MKRIKPVSDKKKVVVAMSGGVDSSAAAALLLENGFSPIGVTMNIWAPDLCKEAGKRSCCSLSAIESARQAASKMDIPFYVLNLRKEFRKVIDYFCEEYLKGRTPNPCIKCNEWIKFGVLLAWAKRLGVSFVATGHYVRIAYSRGKERYVLRRGIDPGKDQSYALFSLTQRQLAHVIAPLGGYYKKDVKEMARLRGFKAVSRPESQEICFVPKGDYREIVRRHAKKRMKPGSIKDSGGAVLGKHRGIGCYTVGQRRGLGIAAGRRKYVVRIDSGGNSIIIGDLKEGMGRVLIADGLNWIDREGIKRTVKARAKIRYNHPPAPCRVTALDSGRRVRVEFDDLQQFITPGQAVVFYKGDTVMGGGWIRERAD